jgi:hypothetical protein
VGVLDHLGQVVLGFRGQHLLNRIAYALAVFNGLALGKAGSLQELKAHAGDAGVLIPRHLVDLGNGGLLHEGQQRVVGGVLSKGPLEERHSLIGGALLELGESLVEECLHISLLRASLLLGGGCCRAQVGDPGSETPPHGQ